MRMLGFQLQLAAIIIPLLVISCDKPRPVQPELTVDEQIAAAAEFVLECMSSAGAECVPNATAASGWSAQGDLELIVETPPALLAERLDAAANQLDRGGEAQVRTFDESRRAISLTRDLSCRSAEIHNVGELFANRRKLLLERARWLGLRHTSARASVDLIGRAASKLDQARLVVARCTAGKAYVLLTPPTRELEPDDDPRAYAGGGWEVVVISSDRQRILHGYVHPPSAATPRRVVDHSSPDFVDPWIPASEVDL